MRSFKQAYILRESLTTTLYPKDLYNFYFLATLLGMGSITGDYAQFITSDFLQSLKKRYLVIFKELLYNQILKYVKRGRVDSDLTMENLDSAKDSGRGLYQLIQKTFRSDMKRRNDVWNFIGEYLAALENSNTVKDIAFYIDRLNNCIHNTHELIFSKFPNAEALLSTFDEIHKARSLDAYKSKVNRDIREIYTNG